MFRSTLHGHQDFNALYLGKILPPSPALSEDKSVPKAPTQLWASFAQLNLQQKVFLTFPSFPTLFYWIIWLWAWGMNCRHRVTQSLSPWRNSTGSLKWGADLGYFTLFFFSPASNHNRNLKQNCPKLSRRFRIQSSMGAIWTSWKEHLK